MADKLSQQIVDALSRAAADPAGVPLYAGKADPGLFPATAAAKPAAQKCLADGLLAVVRNDGGGRAARERYGLTDAGWEYLLSAVNPKQVLEDFVRVLEARQGEVGELLAAARRMADSLAGLERAVARVLPQVSGPHPLTPSPTEGGGTRPGGSGLPPPLRGGEGAGGRGLLSPSTSAAGRGLGGGVCTVVTLADAVLARLAGWSAAAAAGQDCPLPDLYRGLDDAPSVGAFHDALRDLHAAGAVYLHPWTGPLYALPEPTFALLIGHGVCYYASLRSAGVRGQGSGVGDDPGFVRTASF